MVNTLEIGPVLVDCGHSGHYLEDYSGPGNPIRIGPFSHPSKTYRKVFICTHVPPAIACGLPWCVVALVSDSDGFGWSLVQGPDVYHQDTLKDDPPPQHVYELSNIPTCSTQIGSKIFFTFCDSAISFACGVFDLNSLTFRVFTGAIGLPHFPPTPQPIFSVPTGIGPAGSSVFASTGLGLLYDNTNQEYGNNQYVYMFRFNEASGTATLIYTEDLSTKPGIQSGFTDWYTCYPLVDDVGIFRIMARDESGIGEVDLFTWNPNSPTISTQQVVNYGTNGNFKFIIPIVSQLSIANKIVVPMFSVNGSNLFVCILTRNANNTITVTFDNPSPAMPTGLTSAGVGYANVGADNYLIFSGVGFNVDVKVAKKHNGTWATPVVRWEVPIVDPLPYQATMEGSQVLPGSNHYEFLGSFLNAAPYAASADLGMSAKFVWYLRLLLGVSSTALLKITAVPLPDPRVTCCFNAQNKCDTLDVNKIPQVSQKVLAQADVANNQLGAALAARCSCIDRKR